MKTPRLPSIALTLPGAGTLWSLGIILLADALALAILASPFSEFPNIILFDYAWLDLIFALASLVANVAGGALAAAIIFLSLRKQPARLVDKARLDRALLFIHIAVLTHAVVVSLTLLTALDGGLMPPEIVWTTLAGAALVLAIADRMIRNAGCALAGAAASIIALGCAVWYAPAIYGWDLRPLGWYAILASAIPVLAFLTIFLRRYSGAFSESRWRRRGLAVALFAALACAAAAQMAANPESSEFSESLQAAADSRQSPIRLSELTDFEWDTVEIYGGGYLSADDFSPAAREGVDIMTRTRVASSDLDLAVFTKDGETVYYEVFSGNGYYIQYPPSANPMILKREDAIFNLGYSAYGTPRLTLAE